MRSVEKLGVRELSASEIRTVSGGGYIGNTSPLIVYPTSPPRYAPLQA